MFSKDDVVTPRGGPGTRGPSYHLEFPRKFSGAWDLTLSRGTKKGGKTLARITKGSWSNDIQIGLVEHSFETVLSKEKWASSSHVFEGLYGGRFEWKKEGAFSSNLEVSHSGTDSLPEP